MSNPACYDEEERIFANIHKKVNSQLNDYSDMVEYSGSVDGGKIRELCEECNGAGCEECDRTGYKIKRREGPMPCPEDGCPGQLEFSVMPVRHPGSGGVFMSIEILKCSICGYYMHA